MLSKYSNTRTRSFHFVTLLLTPVLAFSLSLFRLFLSLETCLETNSMSNIVRTICLQVSQLRALRNCQKYTHAPYHWHRSPRLLCVCRSLLSGIQIYAIHAATHSIPHKIAYSALTGCRHDVREKWTYTTVLNFNTVF